MIQAYREYCIDVEGMIEVIPPVIVKYKGEGGSEVFNIDYFGSDAYLSQTSQLYLEAASPAVGDCFCVLPSFRAEKSKTPRHLTEYTHVEGELNFVTFDDLLDHLEGVLKHIDRKVGDSGILEEIQKHNPDANIYRLPNEPFVRMTYAEYIEKLKEYGITKEGTNNEYYTADEDVPSKPERIFCDKFKKPFFLTKFPCKLKAFYMEPDTKDPSLSQSVDVCLPGVGEVVGGSLRMTDPEMLQKVLDIETRANDPNLNDKERKHSEDVQNAFSFYKDLRTFGSCHTGGYGLGVSRLAMTYGATTIQYATLFPRTAARIVP